MSGEQDTEYLRVRGEPSPLLHQGPLPDDPIQDAIKVAMDDISLVNGIILIAGYKRLPEIILMLKDRLEAHQHLELGG